MAFRRRLLQVVLAVLAVGLAATSLADLERSDAAREALLARWRDSGIATRHPEADQRVRREPDLGAARSAVARALLVDSLDRGRFAELSPERAAEEGAAVAARIDAAAGLATEVLARRPASWEGALVVGGSRLVAALRRQEAHRGTERWRRPLALARRLAPREPEPARLEVTGELAIWHALSAPERAAARQRLAAALAEPATLQRLLPVWRAVADDEQEFLAPLPDTSAAWAAVARLAAAERRWGAFCPASDRQRLARRRETEGRLAEALARLAGGDLAGARHLLLAVAAAPPEHASAPLVGSALAALPPGPVAEAAQTRLADWLDWALPLWLLDLPSLPPESFARLGALLPGLPPARKAVTALAAGELALAEAIARRESETWSEDWAPYLLARARLLLQRGETREAAAALAATHRSWHSHWLFGQLADRLRFHEAEGGPTGSPTATTWPATEWRWSRGTAALELAAPAPAADVGVAVDVAPPGGAAVELTLDGRWLGCRPVAAGRRLLLDAALAVGPHRLELHTLATSGGRVAPGAVELLAGDP